MSDAPAVSVLITCYNLGQYLEEAVDSVLAQTSADFEILIVDDGSTDPATRSLLDDFTRPKTRVLRTANQGLARARNLLVSEARGRYLSSLDADDMLHPEFLERTMAVLNAAPHLAFVSPHLRMFGDEDRVWPSDSRCDLVTLLSEDTVITPALVRREAVLAVGGYDQNMPHQGDEDWDLWLSLVAAGFSGVVLPEILFFYRRRRGSMCDVCTSRDIHLELYSYLLAKHEAACREQLLPLLLRKDERIGELRRTNVRLQAELARAGAIRQAKAAHLGALRQKLDGARREREVEGQRVRDGAEVSEHDEVAALRSSWSWRLTAPLRAGYDLLNRRSRGSS